MKHVTRAVILAKVKLEELHLIHDTLKLKYKQYCQTRLLEMALWWQSTQHARVFLR